MAQRAGLLLLALLLAACSADRPGLRHDATLRIAQVQEPVSLDPLLLNGTVGNEASALVFSYLIKVDDRGALVPDVATEVPSRTNGGISADERHITYHLHRGVRFSDGTELTAQDVLFTQQAVMNPKNLVQSRLGYDQVESIRVPGRYTVSVTLKKPYAPFLVLFCAPGNVYPIVPKHVLERYPDVNRIDFSEHPVGSGPYTVAEWRRGDRVVFTANPHYWKGAPKIPRIELRFTPDYNAMANRLAGGDVDAVFNTDASVVPQLRAIPSVNVTFTPIDGQGALIFNTQAAPTNDARVRRALAMAIDAKSMVAKASNGVFSNARAGSGMFQWAYNPAALQMPRYDPKAAAQLLDAAGWKLDASGVRRNGNRSLDVLLVSEKGSQTFSVIGNAVEEYERAIGVRVTQKEYVVTEFAADARMGGPVYGGKFNIAQYPFLPGEDPDVTDQLACNRVPPAGFNKPRFCESAMDAALARGVSTFDRAKRQAAYDDVQRILSAKLPMFLTYRIVQISAWPKWLKHQSGAPTTAFWNVAQWSP